jgi:predicted small secreted protein
MKKFRFSMVFGICLVFLLTAGVLGQENIPTKTLPISNLLEVRKDLIRKEGNAFPGGWGEYFLDYRTKTGHLFSGEEASPFDAVRASPVTLEMWWVAALLAQDQSFESDEWAEKEHRRMSQPNTLVFQIYLYSETLNYLAKDNLRFIYQDSIGTRKDGKIYHYELDESKKPIYMVHMGVFVFLPSNPQDITWFSLHILNKKLAGRVDMRWDFQKD